MIGWWRRRRKTKKKKRKQLRKNGDAKKAVYLRIILNYLIIKSIYVFTTHDVCKDVDRRLKWQQSHCKYISKYAQRIMKKQTFILSRVSHRIIIIMTHLIWLVSIPQYGTHYTVRLSPITMESSNEIWFYNSNYIFIACGIFFYTMFIKWIHGDMIADVFSRCMVASTFSSQSTFKFDCEGVKSNCSWSIRLRVHLFVYLRFTSYNKLVLNIGWAELILSLRATFVYRWRWLRWLRW